MQIGTCTPNPPCRGDGYLSYKVEIAKKNSILNKAKQNQARKKKKRKSIYIQRHHKLQEFMGLITIKLRYLQLIFILSSSSSSYSFMPPQHLLLCRRICFRIPSPILGDIPTVSCKSSSIRETSTASRTSGT